MLETIVAGSLPKPSWLPEPRSLICLLADKDVLVGDPARLIDDRVMFRQFYCPGCGGLIENEVAVASHPVLKGIAADP